MKETEIEFQQQKRVTESELAGNRQRARERSRQPCDGGWHGGSQCGQGMQLRLELKAQARLCMQVPSRCPAHFHPPSAPTPPLPRLPSANRIARGWRHSGATSKARSSEKLRACFWHTTKSHTGARQRRTVLKKPSKRTLSQRRASAEQNISFSSPN